MKTTINNKFMRYIIFPIYIVRQYERGIIEQFGKYSRYVEPGLKFQVPVMHVTKTRDIREHTMDIEPQSVITKDNVEIQVDGLIWVRPHEHEKAIKATFYNVDDWKRAIVELAQTNLRQEFGALTLDESLVAREKISNNLQLVLDKMTDEWGLKVSKVEIKQIDPPSDIKTAMHKQKSAEQERRSMKLLATGKYEAAEQEKLASIQQAEGKKEASIRVAEGRAEAIKLVNESAEKYFKGNAMELKKMEVTESSLKDNSKVILAEKGIKPSIILGDLPVKVKK